MSGGSFVRQIFLTATGHLVWNLQPGGGLIGFGISPEITASIRFDVGSGSGTAEIKAFV